MVQAIQQDSPADEQPEFRAFQHRSLTVIDSRLTASQIRHDIHHELATIVLLADIVASSNGIEEPERVRLKQLSEETRWLDRLHRAYYEVLADRPFENWSPPTAAVQFDTLASEVVSGLRLTSMASVRMTTSPVQVCANRLALWRVLRNLMENAFRAAGPQGNVEVRIGLELGWAVAQIDDDGPGFGCGPNGMSSLGLGIAQGFAVDRGGAVEIGDSELGGCCVRLLLPPIPDFAEWEGDGQS